MAKETWTRDEKLAAALGLGFCFLLTSLGFLGGLLVGEHWL